MIENLFPATRPSLPPSLSLSPSLPPAFARLARSWRFARNQRIEGSVSSAYTNIRDECEILTGETQRRGEEKKVWTRSNRGEKRRPRKRGRKRWAQPPPRWLPPTSLSLLSRQVYDEPTQTRHLAANWPPSYRSLAFFLLLGLPPPPPPPPLLLLLPIPNPVWNPTARSPCRLALPTHAAPVSTGVHR